MNDVSKLSDNELVALLKATDHAAFAEIYKRYWQKLYATAVHKIDDFSEAEDLVQQLFVTLWERREQLEISSSLSSYLAVAVKYRVFKSLAKASRYAHFASEQAVEEAIGTTDNSTQEWLEFEEVRHRLAELVATLPDKCRLVYQMTREEGLSQKQTAEILNISEKTVQSHMNSAYKVLKNGLKRFFLML